MNKVIITGRFTKDIEVRTASNGKHVARFTIAVNRGKTKEGVDLGSDFITCTAWESRADNLKAYCGKGDMIMIEGAWRTGSYEDNGRTVYTNELAVDRFEFMSSKQKSETNAQTAKPEEPIVITPDDLPF